MEAKMSNAKGFVIAVGLASAVLMCVSPSDARADRQEGLRMTDTDISARYRARYYRSYAFFRPAYYRGSSWSYRRGSRSGDWVAIHGAAR